MLVGGAEFSAPLQRRQYVSRKAGDIAISSTKDKIEGCANEAGGSVKKRVGKLVGSERLQTEGALQELKGEWAALRSSQAAHTSRKQIAWCAHSRRDAPIPRATRDSGKVRSPWDLTLCRRRHFRIE